MIVEPEGTTSLSVMLDRDELQTLKHIADLRGLTVSGVVAKELMALVKDYQNAEG